METRKLLRDRLRGTTVTYILVGVMAVIVAVIMIFGGGKEAISGKPGSLSQITAKCTSYDEIVGEDGVPETVVISTSKTQAKFSVDAVEIVDYEAFIATLKEKPELVISYDAESKPLLNQDEIIEIEEIIAGGVEFKGE
ncbi:MAG: hypothetical protein PHV24_05835 [Candidatus Kapabacteria bacterium]|nr:hypothetical protein [Candidatus Kapabacteria bacterium]